MKRGTSLRRKKPLSRKRRSIRGASLVGRKTPKTTSRGKGPARDSQYLAAVRELPCVVCGNPGWFNEAHHAGRRPGVAMKCSDYETISLDRQHHRDWHSGSGPFKGWTRSQRRAWADERIAETQARLGYTPTEADR